MRRTLVIHPFLLALFFILFSYAQNKDELSLSDIWTSVVVLLGFTIVVLLLFALVLRSAARAGMLVSLFLLLFFSYGYLYRALWEGSAEVSTSHSQTLLIVWAVIFVGGSALLLRIRRGLDEITKILNVMTLVLVTFSLVDIALYEFRTRSALEGSDSTEVIQLAQSGSVQADTLPDIYYIILDGYARADILEELYNYDNSEFLEFLEQRGFFVADQGRANYAHTSLSLASSLNLDYLDDLASRVDPEFNDRQPLQRMIGDSAAVQFLKEQGYLIVAFPSGYAPTNLDKADVYMDSGPSWNALEVLLLGNTPIPWMVRDQGELSAYTPHISRLRYTLEHLADSAQLESPRFVFAHIIAPHPPFVFDSSGNEIPQSGGFTMEDGNRFVEMGGTTEEYLNGYTGQLSFVNDRMMTLVDDLLSSPSSQPTIVILQADHGPGLHLDWEDPENTYHKERLAILNAVRLPEGDSAGLYDEMTPVNTFRLIFNQYFGTELELLEDESYFAIWDRPYEFINVTDAVRSGEPVDSLE